MANILAGEEPDISPVVYISFIFKVTDEYGNTCHVAISTEKAVI